jgi:hypothetical protein
MAKTRKQKKGSRRSGEQVAANRLIDAPRWNIPTGEVMRPGGRGRGGVYKTILQTAYGNGGVLTGNVVSPQFFAYGFALNQFANFAAYAALFDSYKISTVELRFSLRHPGTGNIYPRLAYFGDFDDGTPPTTDVAVYSHPKTKVHVFSPTNNEFAVSVSPRVSLSTYQSGAFSGYSQPPGPVWVDCNNPAVLHFGLKGVVDNFTDTTQDIEVSFKAWLEFRDPL